jgi:predicted nucleotidyltransferase/uncharacterized protein (UPF0332 family)
MAKNNKTSEKSKANIKDFPSLNLVSEVEIATDFANKVYKKFDKLVKSIILFGSTVKKTNSSGSDIDIIILIDDASVQFDQELIAWYREELSKLISINPYKKELHINTVKLTTWWHDLLRGDPVVINIIRYGEEILDFGGFFRPLRILLQQGRIKSTPEAIYNALERAPMHLVNSKKAEMAAIEGLYWAMVDSANALLMAAKVSPPSPEQIPELLAENFVSNKMIDSKYIVWYNEVYHLYKGIVHGQITDIKGENLDELQDKTSRFIGVMAETIGKIINKN